MLLVMMDAIVYFLENDQPIESARRYFHQQRVLSESIMAEITTADAEIKANFGAQLPVEVFIDNLEPPWNSLRNFRELHTNSTPTKAKQKYLSVLDLLTNHHTVTSLQGNMTMILSQTVTRVMACWSSFEEALGPPPSSSPALSRRSMSADSSSFDREDEMSSSVGMGPMLGALRPFYQAQRRRSHSPTQLQIQQQQYQHHQQQHVQQQFQQPFPNAPTQQQQSLAASTSSSSSLSITIPSAHRYQHPAFINLAPSEHGQQSLPFHHELASDFHALESMENVFGPPDHTDEDHMDIVGVDLLDVNMHQLDWDAFMTEIAHSDEFIPQHHTHSASTDSFYLAGMRTATFSNSDNQLMVHHPGAMAVRSKELHSESTEHDEVLAKQGAHNIDNNVYQNNKKDQTTG